MKSEVNYTGLSFNCMHCGVEVLFAAPGTRHRNHCPFCLWSVHKDKKPGDRQSECNGLMAPVGLTTKKEKDEAMVVHKCERCGEYAKNRLAGDDEVETVVELLVTSESGSPWKLLTKSDTRAIITQLVGKPNVDKYLLK